MSQPEGRNLAGSLVPDLIATATLRFPDKAAVIHGASTLTFAQVSDRASRLHGALDDRDIGEGRRVAFIAMNDLEFLEIRVGAQRARTILVPLNYRLSEAELHSIVEDADVDLLIVGRGLEELGPKMPSPLVWYLGEEGSYEAALAAATPRPVPPGYAPEDICHISYTSGTTARPKGVMLSNRSIHFGTMAMGHELGSHPDTVFLQCTPLFHIGSQVGYSCSYFGGTLTQIQFDVDSFLEVLDRDRATHTQLVPAMVQMVLDRWGDRPVSSLQRVLYGAAPMPPSLLRQAIDTWGCEFVNGYGSTESTGISFLTPADHDPEHAPELLASVGRSSFLETSRLADENDDDVAQGEIGEVLARGAALMSGYWRNPEATEEALRGGWMHTGDLAYRDEQGYLYLVDRRNDKIVTGGENVFPSEIEHVLATLPGVHEAAVIGVPDRIWGEAVTAIIVPRAGATLTEAEVIAHCRASLAGYKVPKNIRFDAEDLPRTPTGKLLRRELRKGWPAVA